MNTISKFVSAATLLLLLLLPLLHFTGSISLAATKAWLLVVTILWFASAPVCMGRVKR